MKVEYIVTAPNVYMAECKAKEYGIKTNRCMFLTYDLGGIVAIGRLKDYWNDLQNGKIKLIGMTIEELKRWCK